MAINGIGGPSPLTQMLVQMRQQLETLQQQLATGKISDSYAGMGVNRGLGIGLRAQLSDLTAFADTMTNLNVRINLANTVLERMVKLGSQSRDGALKSPIVIEAGGQTAAQKAAEVALGEMVQLLNTQSGDRYLFSGRDIDQPAVAEVDVLLNGTGSQAGLRQIIAERRQADVGADGLGRLVVSQPTTTSVGLAEDVAGSPFGFKLTGATSTLTGSTVTGPTGSPPALSVDLGATNPAAGEKVRFTLSLPDGTSSTIELTATTEDPPPAGSFLIGVDTVETAGNLEAALTAEIGKLADTTLIAASAMEASDNFFKDNPPLRVSGVPLNAATTLVPGTATDTVSWYTGEAGSDPARGTAVARIDQSIVVQYGMRANEEGLRWQLQNMAVFAAVTTTPGPDANAQIVTLNERVAKNLSQQSGQQSVLDIQAQIAGAQGAIKSAQERQLQSKAMLHTMVDQIEGVSDEEVASKILSLQTSLQASYQTTSMLYQLSLVKFI